MPDTSDETNYRVVVLELTNLVSRIRTDRPNIYVGVTTRIPQQLAEGLNNGKYKPAWARNNVVGLLDKLAPTGTFTYMEAKQLRDDLKRQLRTKGYTVNRNTTVYRTYVINLDNPNLADPGKGYVYVGQTSKPQNNDYKDVSPVHAAVKATTLHPVKFPNTAHS